MEFGGPQFDTGGIVVVEFGGPQFDTGGIVVVEFGGPQFGCGRNSGCGVWRPLV